MTENNEAENNAADHGESGVAGAADAADATRPSRPIPDEASGAVGPTPDESGTHPVASRPSKRPYASLISGEAAAGDAAAVDAVVGDAAAGVTTGEQAEGAEPAPTELERVRAAHTLRQQLEALLIVADEPLSAVTLATATDRPVREVRAALAALAAVFDGAPGTASATGEGSAPRGFQLREVAGGYRFYVRESLDPLVAGFVQQQTPSKLSQAALETLAVIAYRQPISRGAVAAIRAVNVDSVVRTLLGRGLITEVGQDPETTATLYGTTEALLGHLGISDISELPPIAPLLDEPTEGFDHESL